MAQTQAEEKAKSYKETDNIAEYQRSLRDVAVLHSDCCWDFPDGSTLEFYINKERGLKVKTHKIGSKKNEHSV